MSETEMYTLAARSDTEIVFQSVDELNKFWDALVNGKWTILSYKVDGKKKSELINPDIHALVVDKKIKLTSVE